MVIHRGRRGTSNHGKDDEKTCMHEREAHDGEASLHEAMGMVRLRRLWGAPQRWSRVGSPACRHPTQAGKRQLLLGVKTNPVFFPPSLPTKLASIADEFDTSFVDQLLKTRKGFIPSVRPRLGGLKVLILVYFFWTLEGDNGRLGCH